MEEPAIRGVKVAKAITGEPVGDLLLCGLEFHIKVGCCMFPQSRLMQ